MLSAVRTFRNGTGRLRDYDGVRSWWRVAAGVLIALAVPLLALGGPTTATLLVRGRTHLVDAVVAAAIGLGGPAAATFLVRHSAWQWPLQRRLDDFELLHGGEHLVNVAIEPNDFAAATKALRRRGCYVHGGRLLGTPPPESPSLSSELTIFEPRARAPSDSSGAEDFWCAVQSALDQVGIPHRRTSHGRSLPPRNLWPSP